MFWCRLAAMFFNQLIWLLLVEGHMRNISIMDSEKADSGEEFLRLAIQFSL